MHKSLIAFEKTLREAASKDLSPEELEALEKYKKAVGRNWKQRLSDDWMQARSDEVDPGTYAILHRLRNRLGPSWLVRFKFADYADVVGKKEAAYQATRQLKTLIALQRETGKESQLLDRLLETLTSDLQASIDDENYSRIIRLATKVRQQTEVLTSTADKVRRAINDLYASMAEWSRTRAIAWGYTPGKEATMNPRTAFEQALAAQEVSNQDPWLTPEDVADICLPCAHKMASLEIPKVRLSQLFGQDGMPKTAAEWRTLPTGWTDESRKAFWDSIGGSVTKCMEKIAGHVDDPGAFCAALKDRIEGRTRDARV
jgi:hypothetical protein